MFHVKHLAPLAAGAADMSTVSCLRFFELVGRGDLADGPAREDWRRPVGERAFVWCHGGTKCVHVRQSVAGLE